jgi:uncharacterized protein YbjT (DUF2867 family)
VRVLVTGGRGMLGRHVVEQLRAAGHDAVSGSRSSNVEIDLASGAGLEPALEGAESIVHCASNPRGRNAREVEVEGTARLAEAARRAGTSHLVYISIVGVDRVPYAYYEYKLHAEKVLEQGGLPWSILRATQFFPFLARRLIALPLGMVAPRGFPVQPVATEEVAGRLVRAVVEGPGGRLPDLGGPEIREVADFARSLRAARHLRRPILRPWLPGKLAAAVRAGGLTTPGGERGTRTWEEWLAANRP